MRSYLQAIAGQGGKCTALIRAPGCWCDRELRGVLIENPNGTFTIKGNACMFFGKYILPLRRYEIEFPVTSITFEVELWKEASRRNLFEVVFENQVGTAKGVKVV